MKRREILKQMFLGAISAKSLVSNAAPLAQPELEYRQDSPTSYHSKWHAYPDMAWTGEDLWAQRLQDWRIKNGELLCLVPGFNRTVNILTHQLAKNERGFNANMGFRFLNKPVDDAEKISFSGIRLGIKGSFEDYRSVVIYDEKKEGSIDIGITRSGYLFIGKIIGDKKVDEKILTGGIRLSLTVIPQSSGNDFTKLKVLDKSGNTITSITSLEYNYSAWDGNIAIVSHFNNKEKGDQPTVAVSHFNIEGEKLYFDPKQVYGAIYFVQYTVQSNVLKLTAQLAPVDIAGAEASLYIKKGDAWVKERVSKIHPLARIATFRIENWDAANTYPYKVVYVLPFNNGKEKEYSYEGSIAKEPLQKSKVKALSMSCNGDYGFPDNEVVENALKHKADLAFFLGDQFYEGNGGFGIQMNSLEKACLDYLRKWYQFGWSYREIFRHIPTACLLDDHDVYHGNIWGSGGRAANKKLTGSAEQDSGGYKMPADWVNMAQLTQTSHMPDPFDPTPVLQNIGVYYTHWEYGGISFGIVEDRKFKSAPKDILPDEAKVFNGYAENPAYDQSKIKSLEAQLLGERQMRFLSQWSNQWNKNTHFKVLISATPFCCLQTLPRGTKNDQVTPKLPIPEKGEYVTGDALTQDMDTNGWPHNRRDEVLKLLRKNFTLHICGDQHLPSIVQYGTDEYADSGFAFAVPALCNIWPRRWWPPVSADHKSLPGQPAYTGNFEDGFTNKITVHAAASPYKSRRQPELLYDRVTGYGVVDFDKEKDEVTMHCFPRYVDPVLRPNQQYDGWPVTINRLDNYGKIGMKRLPPIQLGEKKNYFVQVFKEKELLYQMNIRSNHFVPFVLYEGAHSIVVTDNESGLVTQLNI